MSEPGSPAPASPAGSRRRGSRRSGLGQGLVEYGLIAALIALFTILGLVFFGDTVAGLLDFIGRAGSGS